MPEQTANTTGSPQQTSNRTKSDTRSVWIWILTGYGAAFLGLLGLLAYYFSNYITH